MSAAYFWGPGQQAFTDFDLYSTDCATPLAVRPQAHANKHSNAVCRSPRASGVRVYGCMKEQL